MGVFIMEDAKKGAFVARYSGEQLNKIENSKRTGNYRMKVHNNLFLDAEDSKHFEGRYINDCKGSKWKKNVRFAANYTVNTCKTTGYKWVKIIATRNIKAGEELFLSYGKDYWNNHTEQKWMLKLDHNFQSLSMHESISKSMWAEPAVIPSGIFTPQKLVNKTLWAPSAQIPNTTPNITSKPQSQSSQSQTLTHTHTQSTHLNETNPPFIVPLSPILTRHTTDDSLISFNSNTHTPIKLIKTNTPTFSLSISPISMVQPNDTLQI